MNLYCEYAAKIPAEFVLILAQFYKPTGNIVHPLLSSPMYANSPHI